MLATALPEYRSPILRDVKGPRRDSEAELAEPAEAPHPPDCVESAPSRAGTTFLPVETSVGDDGDGKAHRGRERERGLHESRDTIAMYRDVTESTI